MAATLPQKAGGLLLVLGALGLLLWQMPGPDMGPGVVLTAGPEPQVLTTTPAAPAAPQMAVPEPLLAGQQPFQNVEERVRARRVGAQALFPDAQAYAQARQKVSLFAEGAPPSAIDQSLLVNERRRSDARQWIRYDLQVLAARAEGDQFLLPIDGIAMQAQIDTVELLQGQYRWSGRILGHGGGSFHITQSFADQYAIATLQTPAGEFLLEAKNGIGWIAASDKEFVLPDDGHDGIVDTNAAPHKH